MNQLNQTTVTVNDECGICLENFKLQDQPIKLGCSHVFHKRCIEKWTVACSEKRNKAIERAAQNLRDFRRNGRQGNPPKDYIPNAGSCPTCREQLSVKVTSVKVQSKIKENEANTNDLRNKPTETLSARIHEAICMRNFNKARALIEKDKFYLDLNFIITILNEDIKNNEKNNIIAMLDIIKYISHKSATNLHKELTNILDSLLIQNNMEIAQLFINRLES